MIRWHAIRERFNNIDIKTLPRCSAGLGHCGQLESVKEELLAWIFERRERGLVVSTLSVITKACCLLPLMEVGYFVTRCLLKNIQLFTAWEQRCRSVPPVRCAKRCRSSRTLSVRCSKDWSVIYSGSSKWTRRQYCFRCIPKNARDSWHSTNDTRRATVALTIMAAGDQLVQRTARSRNESSNTTTPLASMKHNAMCGWTRG